MKLSVKLFMASLVVAGLALVKPISAAPETWTGTISDSMCKGSHGDKGGTPQKDHDCAVTCAKNGGFVFVTEGKDKKPLILKIADQKSADLVTHAGHKVTVTGELKGDTVTITKITMIKQ
ncbi:MAG TPA: hypothetical protein VFV78_02470 [Vicinamibacterales bacterium]|nr:hypothetical protein [Vicinamibacterales bacterium]